ncbi:hypothetical protein [Sphingomonas morindae]|uniref:Uncharacterized protein n=1 Tax=Sphingomonas morindae TaxID=1541170 RepID=A0ABY4XDN0_9SPHN|nr:hypothetical protein [Sphingomonas morindae]USI74954.1 hypothetical protein LHA26_17445 [Sphingomonas morindae]
MVGTPFLTAARGGQARNSSVGAPGRDHPSEIARLLHARSKRSGLSHSDPRTLHQSAGAGHDGPRGFTEEAARLIGFNRGHIFSCFGTWR